MDKPAPNGVGFFVVFLVQRRSGEAVPVFECRSKDWCCPVALLFLVSSSRDSLLAFSIARIQALTQRHRVKRHSILNGFGDDAQALDIKNSQSCRRPAVDVLIGLGAVGF